MRNSIYKTAILTFSLFLAMACDQKTVEWPDDNGGGGAGGECGSWYPGAPSGEDTADTGLGYDIEEGLFPCAVWESVRLNGEDTFFNVGDEHLKVKHGVSNAKALVIPVSSTS